LIKIKIIWNTFWISIFLFLAKLHPKNAGKENYPQLWNCWPKWTAKWSGLGYCKGHGDNVKARVNPLWFIRTRLCGFLTGHELSETEWGYGGGRFVDRNCRWCDLLIQVPKQESPPPNCLKDNLDCMGFND